MVQSEDTDILERRAAEDLRAAEILLDNDDELLAQIGFHLQQFIEKRMKIGLQKHDVDYPKTHDLVMLLNLFPHKGIGEDDEIFAYVLSRFAVESRYSAFSKPPFNGQQMLDKTKKFADLIETLWDDA